MDVSEGILANLDVGNPCWHDGLLGTSAISARPPSKTQNRRRLGWRFSFSVGERKVITRFGAIGLMKKRPLRGWRRGLKAREKLALTSV